MAPVAVMLPLSATPITLRYSASAFFNNFQAEIVIQCVKRYEEELIWLKAQILPDI